MTHRKKFKLASHEIYVYVIYHELSQNVEGWDFHFHLYTTTTKTHQKKVSFKVYVGGWWIPVQYLTSDSE